ATIVQMAVVLGATHPATLTAMAVPLISAGLMAVAYGAWFLVKALRQKAPETIEMGRAFSFRSALILAATMGAVLLAAAALNAWLGRAGLIAGTAIAGFADTHSPAVSVASLAAGGKLEAAETLLPILLAMSTNTITKMVLAAANGGGRFASQVIPGLLLTIAAGWLGGLQSVVN
ncbi:MAG: DUF4010 domain-containing protein, partial [Nitrosospira sp.]